MIRIQPYKLRSGSARSLSKHMGVLLTTPKQKRKHGDFDTIINWGSGKEEYTGEYINTPRAVRRASNKLSTFKTLADSGVGIPEWTSSRAVAQEWLDAGKTVVERSLLHGSQGRGIRILSGPDSQLRDAPLYTEYVKKQDEYRVHVFGGKVLDVQQKKKRQEVPNERVNYQIRNCNNGWVFCRGDVTCPRCVLEASVRAVDCLGLDFGGVDVGYNAKRDEAYVFEVNTAPGLEGTTLQRYYDAFTEVLPVLRGGMYRKRRGQ